MAWVGASRWSWLCATLTLLGCIVATLPVHGQATTEITPLGTDAGRGVDRYQIVVGPGDSFWEIGTNRLPMISLEQGNAKAVEPIEQGWRAAYPDRAPNELRPGDSFTFEVPAGTFVSKSFGSEGDRRLFESFSGDQLTTYPRDPVIMYRLRPAATPDRAEVLINGGPADEVEEAKRVYEVDPPDFLQVRAVRGALQERSTKLSVDLTRKHLDDLRNYRDRATRVEDTPENLKAYSFDRGDGDIPFVRVEDGIGDETDPGRFPRVFRVAYYRDGTVRKYMVTESGDSLGALTRPDSAAWTKILPAWQEWLPGQPEALPPFTPALSAAGTLQPGRILVIAFRPRSVQASPRPSGSAPGGSGLQCLGLPLGLLVAAGAWLGLNRPAPL
jgi:hypothetical protein